LSQPVDVGILGLGGVGRGLLELWSERPEPRFRIAWASDTTGAVIAREGIRPADLLRAKRGNGLASLPSARFEPHAKPTDLVDREPVEILLNLLPCDYESGGEALPSVVNALERGIHVVSAEKASLVLGVERLRAAQEKAGAQLRYSACVGGSVPFIPILEQAAAAHQVQGATGVVNATTTYILTELEARRAAPREIIDQARRLGILERDERHDLDGWDLAAKATILHNTMFPEPISWKRVKRTGIQPFLKDPESLVPGTRLVARVTPGRVDTEAKTLPMHSPLRVYGLENALLIDTPNAGELFVRGIGAGGRGTATNVYGDLLRVARHTGGESPNGHTHVPQTKLHAHL